MTLSPPEPGTPSEAAAGAAPHRCGFVAVVGAPNVGKSTLINRLVGSKVTIVSPKAQTTRMRVLGIVVHEGAQIVLIDTPGLFQPRFRLDAAMVATAWRSMDEADATIVLIDGTRADDPVLAEVVGRLRRRRRRAVAAVNKIDLIEKPALLQMAADLDRTGAFARIFMISALTGDGVDALVADLAAALPEGPWLFPDDEISDLPLAVLSAEITREKLYYQLQEELPYASAVRTESWRDQPDGSVRVEQTIFVERPGQKAIVIGKGGGRIKRIGEASRRELGDLLGRPVHLFLRVKVRDRWRDAPDGWQWHRLERPDPPGR
jgi:GTP-binding protein Era